MIEYEHSHYCDGHLEKRDGRYVGKLKVDGVDLSPIEGLYFKENGKMYLWVKRPPILEYNVAKGRFVPRPREPRWEAYLEKQPSAAVAYMGTFAFMRFKYRITGIWDAVLGESRQRLNLFVERLPKQEQTIINAINERKRKSAAERDRP